jgi:DNA-binding GntR family transcriptional regulator
VTDNGKRLRYLEIAEDIRQRIRRGQVGPDGRVGTFGSLEEDYGAAKNTIDKALGVLREEGTVVTFAGKGIFVSGTVPREAPVPERVAALEKRVDELEAQMMDLRANALLDQRRHPGADSAEAG